MNPQQPSPEQLAAMQRQLIQEAANRGLTVPQYIEQLKAHAMQQHMQQKKKQGNADGQSQPPPPPPPQQQQQQQIQRPLQPGPPNPAALAVARFLRAQDLKPRTCILDEKRRDMFRVKRAIRALHSDAYRAARAKNPLLPEVHDRATAENTFKLLPLSLLALRVSKLDPDHAAHAGHSHAKPKRVKGLWTVRIEQHQNAADDDHYAWLWEGSQWKTRLYGAAALVAVITFVLFPLWPLFMRQGVWYLSIAAMGLLGCLFAMAFVRLILFVVTMFAVPPGLWLYPNLFEDVGFWASFKPLWAWHEDPAAQKASQKAARKAKRAEKHGATGKTSKSSQHAAADAPAETVTTAPPAAGARATGADAAPSATGTTLRRQLQASVEEAADDE